MKTLASTNKGSGECSLNDVQQSMLARRTKTLDSALPISNQNRLYPKPLKHLCLADKTREERKAVINPVALYTNIK